MGHQQKKDFFLPKSSGGYDASKAPGTTAPAVDTGRSRSRQRMLWPIFARSVCGRTTCSPLHRTSPAMRITV